MNIWGEIKHLHFLLNNGGFAKVSDHVRENVWFDITNGTNTSSWLKKTDFKDKPKNFEHGVRYRASATSEICAALKTACKEINAADCGYYDLGCGKGKTNFIAADRYPFIENIGIDYYQPLLDVAQSNIKKSKSNGVIFLNQDMSEFNSYQKNSIIYLYNPAGEKIIDTVRQNIESACDRAIVIYNKPEHEGVFNDWRVITRKTHRDRDHCTTIFGWNV
ncbi:MAG: methyltransferase domain-containing protein [Alphaproteobacteria bacterium]